jgi:predicted permease
MTLHGFLGSFGRDLRRSLRGLRRARTFAAASVVTLALGIGTTTAIFSVVDAVLIKPLSYPESDRLVSLGHRAPGIGSEQFSISPGMYLTYRDENRTFEQLGIYGTGGFSVTGAGDPEQARGAAVTYGLLEAIGVRPMLGRLFTPDDAARADAPEEAILTYAYWQRKFGGDEAIIGRVVDVDGAPNVVVGVMPAGFDFLDVTPEVELIRPMRFDPSRTTHGGFNFRGVARLEPGVTLEQASADVERMLPVWLDAWPTAPGQPSRDAMANWRVAPALVPLKTDIVGNVATTLWTLLGTIGGVLLIACANIANLTLVRCDARRHEFAVRGALGAGRARIAREILLESVVLGVAGGALGLLLAAAALSALRTLDPSTLPRLHEIGVDVRVLAFTIAASLGASVLFGSLPALKQGSLAGATMAGGGRGMTATRERHATRRTLVVVQVALALVLIVSAGLMIRTFYALRDVDPGFTAPESIQIARISITNAVTRDPAEITALQRAILDRIAATPGVVSAAYASAAPMEPGRMNTSIAFIDGREYDATETPAPVRFKFVSPGYFGTMGTRLVAGRDMTWTDIDNGGHVAVVSHAYAKREWGDAAAALGKRIRENRTREQSHEIIGVVQDVHEDWLQQEPPATVYWPARSDGFYGNARFAFPAIAYVVRSERAGTASLVDEIRRAVWASNANLPVFLIRTMQEVYGYSLARTSLTLVMLGFAGAMALGLGVVGIYGVIAYVVSQRAREIGIRLALGAQPADVKRMFVVDGLTLAALGAAGGLAAAIWLTRWIASLLYGIGPLDPPTYAAGLGVILAAALLASYVPARRAARIDPMETLRAE